MLTDQSDIDQLKTIIEGILFVANDPVPITHLTQLTNCTKSDIDRAISDLSQDCQERGIRVQITNKAVQFVSAPETSSYIESFLGRGQRKQLSPAALETLAIIAYRQPIGRSEIEKIRGVNCDHAISSIKNRGLISEVGRSDKPGRAYLYGTTFQFLEHFGLEKPEDLPPLPDGSISE